MDEFFSRDPLDLTDQDLATIVAELRRQRANWAVAEAKGKRVAKATGPKVAPSLKDLGLT